MSWIARRARCVEVFGRDGAGAAHFAGEDDAVGGDQRLAGHARIGVGGQEGVEHGVGDAVRDLVGMAFGDGFGREQIFAGIAHGVVCLLSRENAGGTPRQAWPGESGTGAYGKGGGRGQGSGGGAPARPPAPRIRMEHPRPFAAALRPDPAHPHAPRGSASRGPAAFASWAGGPQRGVFGGGAAIRYTPAGDPIRTPRRRGPPRAHRRAAHRRERRARRPARRRQDNAACRWS